MKILSILLGIWNIVVFFTYGTDKLLAKKRARRIRESILILTAFLFGGIGAMFGMLICNHKTSKIKFRLCVPLSVICNIAILTLLFLHIK